MSAPAKPALLRCQSCGTLNRIDLSRLADGPKCARCGKPLHGDQPQPVTDADFTKIVNGSSVPVVVDFYADWCGPCKAMAPTFAAFAARKAGEVLVCKLDTDANPHTASSFGIRGIPTIISFRNGAEFRRHVGMADMATLSGLVQ